MPREENKILSLGLPYYEHFRCENLRYRRNIWYLILRIKENNTQIRTWLGPETKVEVVEEERKARRK